MASPNRRHPHSSFYKYVNGSAAKAVLGHQALRWSSPVKFNDPFDIPRKASLGFTVDELFEACEAEFLKLLGSDRTPGNSSFAILKSEMKRLGIGPDQVSAMMRMFSGFVRPKLETSLQTFTSIWPDVIPRLRLLCMSEVPDGASMWAHYADNHRGAVLEFGANDELDSSWLLAQPVKYDATPPMLPGASFWADVLVNNQPIDWLEFFKDYFYTKTPVWASEKEWRTVSLAPEGVTALFCDQPFHPDELLSVRLGAEMSGPEQDDIAALVGAKYHAAKVLRAVANHEARAITFKAYERGAT